MCSYSEKIKLLDPTCHVSSIQTKIQNGEQLNVSNYNISRSKVDVQFCNKLLYNVLQSLSNKAMKFLLPFLFNRINFENYVFCSHKKSEGEQS